MNFNSLQYLIFLPVITVLYYLLPRRLKNPMLLLASYYFYMCWDARYASLMLLSTALTYCCGRLIAAFPRRKKLWLCLSLFLNLGILFVFKYLGFFAGLIFPLLGKAAPGISLLLPVGISFYTFQALGYTIDVYRGTLPAERNFLNYALFVSFFPQLVAGPIERAENIVPQLKVIHPFRYENLERGLPPFLFGMFKKIVIADNLAVLVNTAYNDAAHASGIQLLFATVCFAVQIYCDFSAYSDIARGSARFLGIELMQNFNAPYLARSVRDFWRRWHISLSGWLRDYLYFPLGGSRVAPWRHCLNILIVFLVSGLWHGAALTFVFWGLMHGLYQVIGIVCAPLRRRLYRHIPKDCALMRLLQWGGTMALVLFAWIFFRANSLSDCALILQRILFAFGSPASLLSLGLSAPAILGTGLCVCMLFAVDFYGTERLSLRLCRKPALRYVLYVLLCMAIFLLGYYGAGYNPQEFIYFQF